MISRTSVDDASARRSDILLAARWCFLNFGFQKTSLEDIAKRANLSRTLLYRSFKDKKDIFVAVFADWLLSRHPAARQAAAGRGSPKNRLLRVCQLLAVELYADMVGAPMAGEFFDVCERLDPAIDAQHRETAIECFETIIGDRLAAEVFLLALDGLYADEPTVSLLEQRVTLLVDRFVGSSAH